MCCVKRSAAGAAVDACTDAACTDAVGQFLQPDFSKGDPNTLGGYRAAHGRPPAFEGSDGASYSVEIVCDETGEPAKPFAAYLLFIRWRERDPVTIGHLETGYLGFGDSEETAIEEVAALSLQTVRAHLDSLISARQSKAQRVRP
jgi:hypothetical protein